MNTFSISLAFDNLHTNSCENTIISGLSRNKILILKSIMFQTEPRFWITHPLADSSSSWHCVVISDVKASEPTFSTLLFQYWASIRDAVPALQHHCLYECCHLAVFHIGVGADGCRQRSFAVSGTITYMIYRQSNVSLYYGRVSVLHLHIVKTNSSNCSPLW